MMYKQNPPSLLDTLIKMFMELGSVAVSNQVERERERARARQRETERHSETETEKQRERDGSVAGSNQVPKPDTKPKSIMHRIPTRDRCIFQK